MDFFEIQTRSISVSDEFEMETMKLDQNFANSPIFTAIVRATNDCFIGKKEIFTLQFAQEIDILNG